MTDEVAVPLSVLRGALRKAWIEYREHQPDAEPDECWAEFEWLAEYLPGGADAVLPDQR